MEYMGRQVEESLIWRPTNPDEVEKSCGALDARKAAAWDGVSPRVMKAVTCELAGSLSCLIVVCGMGTIPHTSRWQGWFPYSGQVSVIPVLS